MVFRFKNIKKDIIMTEKDEKDYKNINVCRFCEKNIVSDKVRDHCLLTGKYRGPAHSKCNINVTQDQSKLLFIFHKFSKYDCHMFFKKLVDKNSDIRSSDVIPKTNEEYISVTYGCIRFIDIYRFLSSSLDTLVRTMVDKNHKTLRNLNKKIVGNDQMSNIVKGIAEEDGTIEGLKKDYTNEIEKLEEALLNYIVKTILNLWKRNFQTSGII